MLCTTLCNDLGISVNTFTVFFLALLLLFLTVIWQLQVFPTRLCEFGPCQCRFTMGSLLLTDTKPSSIWFTILTKFLHFTGGPMISTVIFIITFNNCITLAIGVVCNLAVIYLCIRIQNSEITQCKRSIIMQSILQIVEGLNLTFLLMVSFQSFKIKFYFICLFLCWT